MSNLKLRTDELSIQHLTFSLKDTNRNDGKPANYRRLLWAKAVKIMPTINGKPYTKAYTFEVILEHFIDTYNPKLSYKSKRRR